MVIDAVDKAQSDPAMARSVIDRPQAIDGIPVPTLAESILWAVASAADEIEAWGSRMKVRDKQLRSFIPTESVFASSLFAVSGRNAAFTWELEGPSSTVKRTKELLDNANDGKGWQDLMTKLSLDLYCLAATSRIALGGERAGKRKTIRDIVRDHDPGPVVTIGPDGLMESWITEWHRTPLGPRYWVWLSTDASGHTRSDPGGLFMTNDHPVLTPDGWMPSGDVRAGMMIATGHPEPNDKQCGLLVGTLLGDASLGRARPQIRLTHNGEQVEWLRVKQGALAGFHWTPEQHHGNAYSANSHASSGLCTWRAAWYPDGRKRVARDLVERHFGPEMLAAWYADDGSLARSKNRNGDPTRPGAFLSTQGFPDDDVGWLAALLNRQGFAASTHRIHWRTGSGLRIYLGVTGAARLFEIIGPYLPPSLRHKLPEDASPYDSTKWEMGSARPHFAEVTEARCRPYMSGRHAAKTTYHIGVKDTRNFVAAGLVVHNTQDHGAFMEIVRAGDTEKAPVIGLNHLDAYRCWHSGDPKRPVVYQDRQNKLHLLEWFQVETFAEMPCAVEGLYGMQYCALTRVLRACQVMRNVMIYQQEKTGGRFNRALHIVKGVSHKQITDALTQQNIQLDAEGFLRYMQPLIVASISAEDTIDIKTLELASLPEGWNQEEMFKWYIAILAMGFGIDYQDLAPLPGGGLGTGSQSIVLHMKSRGRGPALFQKLIEFSMNMAVLPKNVQFQFLEQDLAEEKEHAEIKKLRAEAREIDVRTGVYDDRGARQQAFDAGDISQELFDAMGGSDVTPEVTVEDTEQPDEAPAPAAPVPPPAPAPGVVEEEKAARAGPFRTGAAEGGGALRRRLREGAWEDTP